MNYLLQESELDRRGHVFSIFSAMPRQQWFVRLDVIDPGTGVCHPSNDYEAYACVPG
jgi:hypothetical protein